MTLGGVMFEQIMGQSPPLDAIFFCNDDLAQGALLMANRSGIAVPAQVAIAGFNDLRGSDLMNPPLTTVHTPLDKVGEASAMMLLQLIRGEDVENHSLDLGYRLVLRQST
jgi:LacI family gluconate utilization system Gnt-I transcriptional repressor